MTPSGSVDDVDGTVWRPVHPLLLLHLGHPELKLSQRPEPAVARGVFCCDGDPDTEDHGRTADNRLLKSTASHIMQLQVPVGRWARMKFLLQGDSITTSSIRRLQGRQAQVMVQNQVAGEGPRWRRDDGEAPLGTPQPWRKCCVDQQLLNRPRTGRGFSFGQFLNTLVEGNQAQRVL